PADLSMYDAIAVFPLGYNYFPFDTLSPTTQRHLIDYLKSGGRLYAESRSFFLSHYRNDSLHYDYDTLWHFIGLQAEYIDAVEVTYDGIEGIDSEFTTGLHAEVPWNYGSGGSD